MITETSETSVGRFRRKSAEIVSSDYGRLRCKVRLNSQSESSKGLSDISRKRSTDESVTQDERVVKIQSYQRNQSGCLIKFIDLWTVIVTSLVSGKMFS